MTIQQARQGDVYLRRIARMPKDCTSVALDQGRLILASGEVTGHAHVIVNTDVDTDIPPAHFFEAPVGERYLLVDRPCALIHEEHDRIDLSPGSYEVIRQREYSPAADQQVAD